MYALLARAEELRPALTEAIQRDAEAFDAVMAAMKLPRDTDEEAAIRLQALETATLKAAEVPLDTARMAAEVIDLAEQAVTYGNLNAISDGATGGALAHAALTGAGYNVRINVASPGRSHAGRAVCSRRSAASKPWRMRPKRRIRRQLIERGGMPQL